MNFNNNQAQSSKWICCCHGLDPIILKLLNFSIPGTHVSQTEIGGSENIQLLIPGDHVTYDPLDFDFLIDDDYGNYQQVFDWLHRITVNEPVVDEMKTITLYLLSNYGEISNFCVEFENAWPTDLSVVPLDNTNDTTDLQASLTLNFERMTMKRCCTLMSELI